MASQRKSILTFGLMEFGDLRQSMGQSPQQIQAALEAEQKKASDAGFDVETFAVNPNDTVSLKKARELLKSKQWDGVAIGFGVRGMEENTEVFEKLVNLSLEEVKAPLKMMFPVGPHQLFPAIQRVFPVAH